MWLILNKHNVEFLLGAILRANDWHWIKPGQRVLWKEGEVSSLSYFRRGPHAIPHPTCWV